MTPLTNLLTDPWITVRREGGEELTIQPSQITDNIDGNPIIDIVAPRPDFRSALYQFCIGLLQTSCMLKDEQAWLDWWKEPPPPDELATRMEPFLSAFMVAGEGPLFMQDLSVSEQKGTPISALLIDEPGAQSVKFNKDHFTKRDRIPGLSLQYALNALLTMQCMAPAGGAGNRTSLRGGGPLSTLLLPAASEPDTLWHRAWLNVLDCNSWAVIPGMQDDPTADVRIFPWLGPTRVSDKNGIDTLPEDAHSLQHYWGMPRRILLNELEKAPTSCPFSGDDLVITEYRARPWGPNYAGPWRHSLSPHYRPKAGEFLPVHPQPGGFQYRQWHEWAQPPHADNPSTLCATVVSNHLQGPLRSNIDVRIWASGYDMDNMKPRCFYDITWPLFHFPEVHAVRARNVVTALTAIANNTARITREQVRKAWLRRPGDHSDSTNNISAGVASRVYESSERNFFALLARLHACCMGESVDPVDGERWRNDLFRLARDTFDDYVPVESIAHGDPARIARARNGLYKYSHGKNIQEHIDDISNAMEDILSTGAEA